MKDMCLSWNGLTLVLLWSDVTIWLTSWQIKLLKWYKWLLKIVWLKKQKDIPEKMWISVYLIEGFIHWINIDNIFEIIKDCWLCRCIYKIKIWSLKRKVNTNYTIFRTFGMIKPDAYTHIGKIITAIEKSGFVIGNLKMTKMTINDS